MISSNDGSDTVGEDVSSLVIQFCCLLLVQACPFLDLSLFLVMNVNDLRMR